MVVVCRYSVDDGRRCIRCRVVSLDFQRDRIVTGFNRVLSVGVFARERMPGHDPCGWIHGLRPRVVDRGKTREIASQHARTLTTLTTAAWNGKESGRCTTMANDSLVGKEEENALLEMRYREGAAEVAADVVVA